MYTLVQILNTFGTGNLANPSFSISEYTVSYNICERIWKSELIYDYYILVDFILLTRTIDLPDQMLHSESDSFFDLGTLHSEREAHFRCVQPYFLKKSADSDY